MTLDRREICLPSSTAAYYSLLMRLFMFAIRVGNMESPHLAELVVRKGLPRTIYTDTKPTLVSYHSAGDLPRKSFKEKCI